MFSIRSFFIIAGVLFTPTSAIINGTTISNTRNNPFVVSLQWEGKHKCGGSLIGPKTILTAAHCFPLTFVDAAHPEKVTAVVGSADQENPNRRMSVVSTPIWPDGFPEQYKRSPPASLTATHDYMILRLTENIVQSATLNTVRLAAANQVPAVGETCEVLGWGRYDLSAEEKLTNENVMSETFSRWLRRGKVEVVPNCFGDATGYDDFLCTKQYQFQGLPCFGDSGSPLICGSSTTRYLAGFVEGGDAPCVNPDGLVLFVKTAQQLTWITRNIL